MKLNKIHLEGFKSINGDKGQDIHLGAVTVILGANGSGKSNVVSFFKMLNYMTTGALQQYVGKYGVGQLLSFGPSQTESCTFTLHFESDKSEDIYEVKLSHGSSDRLFIARERISYHRKKAPAPKEYVLESQGGRESGLKNDERKTSKYVYKLLSGIHTYQFHDTSDTAKIKNRGYMDDAKYLRSNAGNLAAFLRMLKENYTEYYERIVRHIRAIMPQFGNFSLEPLPKNENENYVRLNWTDSIGSDYLFGPDQISDGSLRFMALATLLLQPPDLLPSFIVLDEPELGLHPSAIAKLGGIIDGVSQKTQILLATQSTRLVDEFSLDDLIIVERDENNRCSVFKKMNPEEMQDWLDRYSLSELWEKNVLGGQP